MYPTFFLPFFFGLSFFLDPTFDPDAECSPNILRAKSLSLRLSFFSLSSSRKSSALIALSSGERTKAFLTVFNASETSFLYDNICRRKFEL